MTNHKARPQESPTALPLEPPQAGLETPGLGPDNPPQSGMDMLLQVVPGDPLGVRSMVVRRLRDRCLLLDPNGVSILILASIAEAQSGTGSGSQVDRDADAGIRRGTEVAAAVERVIDDCVSGRLEVPSAGFPRGGVLSQLARALKVSQVELKRACDRFNRLPASARRAFHALILQRRSLESACRRSAAAAELWSQGAAKGLQEIVGARGSEQEGVLADTGGLPNTPETQTLFG